LIMVRSFLETILAILTAIGLGGIAAG
jgi:hypothetical protein